LKFAYYSHFMPVNKGVKKEPKDGRYRVNDEISARELRVIDDDGKALGIIRRNDALRIAEEKELDLVEIAPQANPPVARLVDYGKFQYEQQKKEKHQRKQQVQQQMKEIRLKWRTDTHDFNFKVRHARNFIEEGNKVKASIMFRGREIVHQDIGQELLLKFIQEMEDIAKVDQPLKSEGKTIHVIMVPDKTKKKKTSSSSDKPKIADLIAKPIDKKIEE
jgi:translation initiation factor IF-3